VHGHRGARGELTVRVSGGDAAPWCGLERVFLTPGSGPAREFAVQHSRAYRDRLVLKLAGIEQASEAAALRGALVHVARDEAPALADGEHHVHDLLGLDVRDERGTSLGRVRDIARTGGVDLLLVTGTQGDELMIPLAREIVRRIDVAAGFLVVRPPEGLLELNRDGGREP
jgi:16S rRNA processing protein RimM